MAAVNKKWALDTNVLIDLAEGQDAAHTLREIALERAYTLHVSPQVIQELSHLYRTHKEDLAFQALKCMREWSILPFNCLPVGHGITEQFSQELQRRRLIQDGEFNDGLILAEASLYGAALLVTSDSHLLDIDAERLKLLFEEKDLFPVSVISPWKLCKLLEPKTAKTAAKY